MKKFKFVIAAACVVALAAFVLAGCTSSSSSSAASASGSGSASASAASASASAASASASAASASASAASASASSAAAAQKFIVGFDAEYPPYGFKAADGSYTGFDLDLAKAVCDMNGWEFEAKPIDWDGKDLELDSGNITCIWNGFTKNDERADKYAWSEPYMLNEQVFVVAKDSEVKDLEGMAGKKVVTQAGSAAFDLLTDDEEGDPIEKAFDGGKVATVPDYNTAFMQLESGAVDVVACDLSIAAYQMSQNPDKYVQLAEPLNSEVYAVGFKLGENEMAAKITDALKKLDQDGTVKTLIDKYAEYGMDYSNWILK